MLHIKNTKNIQKLLIILTILIMPLLLFYSIKNNILIPVTLLVVVTIVTVVIYNLLGYDTTILLSLLLVPYILFTACNILYNNNTLIKYSNYFEVLFIFSLSMLTILVSCEHKYLFKEMILVFAMLLCNIITFITLKYSFTVFIMSTLFYLKYSLIIIIIYNSKIEMNTYKIVLRIFSVVVIMNFIFAVLQIVNQNFANIFVGNYFSAERNGITRSIGMFPWSTELGSWSGVFFILYYFYGRSINSRYFKLISLLCVANIILSQARAALVLILFILLVDKIKKITSVMKYAALVIIIAFILNQFISISGIIQSTIDEYSDYKNMPRVYYILKGIDVLKDNPLFGIGYDRYFTKWTSEIDNYLISSKYQIRSYDNLSTTDSFIAKALPEMGIVGTFLLVILFVLIFRKAYKISKMNNENLLFLYALFYMIIYTLNQSSSLFNRQMGSVLWVVIGMVIKNYYQLKSESQVKISDKNNILESKAKTGLI